MSGYTYFVQSASGGPIKIGSTTKHPQERLKQLQIGSPLPLRLLYYLEGTHHEAALHHYLRVWRLHGEWFDVNAPILHQLVRVAKGSQR